MDLMKASVMDRNAAKGRWFVVFICFLFMALAGGTYIFGIHSDRGINQYVTANRTSETVVHLGDAASVFNVEKFGAVGNGKHDSTERTVAAPERVRKGRRLLELSEPKPETGHGPQHH